VSEFSLVILSLGVSYQHIPQYILSSFIIALVVTALLSSFIIPNTHKLYRMLNPLLESVGLKDHIDPAEDSASNQKHEASIVFLGFYREASSLLREIEDRHSAESLNEIMVVDFNPETIAKLKQKNVQVYYGDIGHSDTLHHLAVHHAKIIFSTIPDSVLQGTSNEKLLKASKEIAPQAKVIVTAETFAMAQKLYQAGADYVYTPRVISARYLADILERIESGNIETIRNTALEALAKREEIIR
jgi:hypothetical protein